jgi:LPXTG-motif cell wall-anchored protein
MPAIRLLRTVTVAVAAVALVALATPARAADTVDDVDLVIDPNIPTVHTRQGEQPQVTLGVRNAGAKPVPGVVLYLYTADRFISLKDYGNCWYYTPSHGNIDRHYAMCRFDGEVAPGTTYRVAETPFTVGYVPAGWSPLKYEQTWYTSDDFDATGLLKPRPEYGYYPSRGSGAPLLLEPERAVATSGVKVTDSNMANNKATTNIVVDYASPSVPPSASVAPSSSASASATVSPSVSTTAVGGSAGGTDGGGLPITGANATLAGGAGAALLAAGLGLYLAARRRHTSFTS